MKTLITVADYFDEDSRNIFQDLGEVDIIENSRDLRESVMKIIEEYDVLAIKVDFKGDKEMLDKARNLKVIASATTGVDHIDLDYAKRKGVEVIFLKGANTSATAEYVFALLFSFITLIISIISFIFIILLSIFMSIFMCIFKFIISCVRIVTI